MGILHDFLMDGSLFVRRQQFDRGLDLGLRKAIFCRMDHETRRTPEALLRTVCADLQVKFSIKGDYHKEFRLLWVIEPQQKKGEGAFTCRIGHEGQFLPIGCEGRCP